MRARLSFAALLTVAALATGPGCRRDEISPRQMRERIAALEKERGELRAKVDELMANGSKTAAPATVSREEPDTCSIAACTYW